MSIPVVLFIFVATRNSCRSFRSFAKNESPPSIGRRIAHRDRIACFFSLYLSLSPSFVDQMHLYTSEKRDVSFYERPTMRKGAHSSSDLLCNLHFRWNQQSPEIDIKSESRPHLPRRSNLMCFTRASLMTFHSQVLLYDELEILRFYI